MRQSYYYHHSCRLETSVQIQSVFSSHVRRRVLSANKLPRQKLESIGKNQKCPPDFTVFWISPDLPMELTPPGLLLLLNKDWRLWTGWKCFYVETNVCSKSFRQLKLSFQYQNNPKTYGRVNLDDLIWNN